LNNRDWKKFFDPTAITTGAFPGFGVHVLLVQKSLKKLNGAHFEPQVQRPANTALRRGFFLAPESAAGQVIFNGASLNLNPPKPYPPIPYYKSI